MIENRYDSLNGKVYLLMAEKTRIQGLFWKAFLLSSLEETYVTVHWKILNKNKSILVTNRIMSVEYLTNLI